MVNSKADQESMIQLALGHLKTQETLNYAEAAQLFGLTRTTLMRRHKGQLSRAEANKRKRKLPPQIEEKVAESLLYLEATGNALNHSQMREFTLCVMYAAGIPPSLGRHWIQRLIQRHPDLRMKIGKRVDNLRVSSTSPDSCDGS